MRLDGPTLPAALLHASQLAKGQRQSFNVCNTFSFVTSLGLKKKRTGNLGRKSSNVAHPTMKYEGRKLSELGGAGGGTPIKGRSLNKVQNMDLKFVECFQIDNGLNPKPSIQTILSLGGSESKPVLDSPTCASV